MKVIPHLYNVFNIFYLYCHLSQDTPEHLHVAAAGNVSLHLLKLHKEHRVGTFRYSLLISFGGLRCATDKLWSHQFWASGTYKLHFTLTLDVFVQERAIL